MFILCDTCSVLMLIRIAPKMFIEKEYECLTVKEVHQEIKRTQKFKEKYPWRNDYLPEIKVENLKNEQFEPISKLIHNTLEAGKLNRKTKRYFDLSRTDRIIAAYTVSNELNFSSTDDDLTVFLEQEYDVRNYCPLEIINIWLQKKLIKWNKNRQQILMDWDRDNEHPQPKAEAKKFEELTGFNYPGPVQK